MDATFDRSADGATDVERSRCLYRRQLILAWVSALVLLAILAGVAVAVFLSAGQGARSPERGVVLAAMAAGVIGAAAVFVVVVAHALRVATFVLRKEVS